MSATIKRRLTKFLGNTNRNIFSKRFNDVNIQELQSIRNISDISDYIYINSRSRLSTLSLKTNFNFQQFQSVPSLKRSRNSTCYFKSLWKSHYAIFIVTYIDKDNRVIVAYRKGLYYTIVAIKKHQLKTDELVKRLIQYNYTNIVNLLEIFYNNSFVYIIYK